MTSGSLSIETYWSSAAAAALLAAMGNEKRFEVLRHLANGELTVNQIAGIVGLSQSALSQHLAVLRKTDIVKTRRDAQTIYYSIHSRAAMEVLALFDAAEEKPRSCQRLVAAGAQAVGA